MHVMWQTFVTAAVRARAVALVGCLQAEIAYALSRQAISAVDLKNRPLWPPPQELGESPSPDTSRLNLCHFEIGNFGN